MNVNTEIKELKQDLLKGMFSHFIKGKMDRHLAIVGGLGFLLLEMADSYTTAYPFNLELPKVIDSKGNIVANKHLS